MVNLYVRTERCRVPRRPRDEDLTRWFGERVRDVRLQTDLSQEALAHASGLGRVYVGLVERGQVTPSLDTIVRLASALGVTPGRLVDDLGADVTTT